MFRSSLRDQSGVLPCVNRFGQGRLGYYVRSSLGSPCLVAPCTVVPNAQNTPKIKLKISWNWLVNGHTYACNSLTSFRYETERTWIHWNLKIRETTWGNLCLVRLQVPKCFVPVQIFWASPKIWLHLVPLERLLCRHKKQFYWVQIIFLSGTKCWWLPKCVNLFLVFH